MYKMKSFVLCICVLIFTLSEQTTEVLTNRSAKQKLKSVVESNIEDDVESCWTENNMTSNDMYEEEEIMTNLHTQPENEQRTRKNGCWVECVLQKQNLMAEGNIKEGQIHAKINEMFEDSPVIGIAHRIARKCLKRVKNITQECEKGFSLYECIAKSLHKVMDHEEHEREEAEEETETGQAE